MELQGCNVLPIAADIRSIGQINYDFDISGEIKALIENGLKLIHWPH